MEKKKRRLWLDICLILLKVIIPVAVLAVLIIFSVGLANVRAEDLQGQGNAGYFSCIPGVLKLQIWCRDDNILINTAGE